MHEIAALENTTIYLKLQDLCILGKLAVEDGRLTLTSSRSGELNSEIQNPKCWRLNPKSKMLATIKMTESAFFHRIGCTVYRPCILIKWDHHVPPLFLSPYGDSMTGWTRLVCCDSATASGNAVYAYLF